MVKRCESVKEEKEYITIRSLDHKSRYAVHQTRQPEREYSLELHHAAVSLQLVSAEVAPLELGRERANL